MKSVIDELRFWDENNIIDKVDDGSKIGGIKL